MMAGNLNDWRGCKKWSWEVVSIISDLDVGFDQHFRWCFWSCVRVGRVQRICFPVAFLDGIRILAINFVRANVNESSYLRLANTTRLENRVGAHHVILGEDHALYKRAVDMCLRREMHNGVNVLPAYDRQYEPWRRYITSQKNKIRALQQSWDMGDREGESEKEVCCVCQMTLAMTSARFFKFAQ